MQKEGNVEQPDSNGLGVDRPDNPTPAIFYEDLRHERARIADPDRVRSRSARMIPAENFMATLAANIDNSELSDAAFRQLVRNTMPIVQH